jgi:hypothetical protein
VGKKKGKSAKPKSTPGSKQAWKLMDMGSTVAATAASREVPALAWRVATGRKPPVAAKNPDAPMREIVLWSFIGGGLAELTRVLIKRSTAAYWVKSTGHLPPDMKPLATFGDKLADKVDEAN